MVWLNDLRLSGWSMQSLGGRKQKKGAEGVADTRDQLCRGGLLAAAEAVDRGCCPLVLAEGELGSHRTPVLLCLAAQAGSFFTVKTLCSVGAQERCLCTGLD